MGQFSWLDCKYNDKHKAILDGEYRTSYVLVPKEFEKRFGKRIAEECYEGYGVFGGYDIFDLVALWNRDYIGTENIREISARKNYSNEEYYIEAVKRFLNNCERIEDFATSRYSMDEMDDKWGTDYNKREWLRLIGIDIACYDEDNANLKYPIKITYDENAVYEDCEPSNSDPDQGWGRVWW